ncbi:anaerobic sulfatase maturase [Anaeromyxobacter sp. PSR-1]|uniref:anaerobic sulfatase maturase n=1 Tax=Anaeromyxobacter sp. PSR-1 TaxID=1300915 RepID=UPI0005E63BCD|nr:anaerobic sulfatase maturase [Anaeromyxobacter sp. PSR-1]GAO01394.1 anaerobic sulfatase-maturating enzyme [Anaeromyxobacter sp. PSR-1]
MSSETGPSGGALPAGLPPRFHLLAKPGGSACNLDCRYCFFLSKEALYPDGPARMSDATLDAYVRQLLESHRGPQVTVAWQGGEPALLGLDFYRRAVAAVERHRRPGQAVEYTFQTNGTLLDDAWCDFFRAHDVLVGLSVDGPRELHDAYRVDRRGRGTFDRVVRGWRLLEHHGVERNVLCTVNAANQGHGRIVYRFFRDELGARWVQFIPVVERATAEALAAGADGSAGRRRPLYTQAGDRVTDRSVGAEGYGRFLVDVFEEWIRHDVGRVFVQLFDVTLEARFGRHLLCLHAPTCGAGPALEANGDVYACDHFVEPAYLLGNLHATHLAELVASPRQRRFGQDKRDALTAECRRCPVLAACNGGCPKDRFARSADGEPGHNYLCPGLRRFFEHTRPAMDAMAALLRQGRAPAEIVAWTAAEDALRGPYAPCPCGSGRKLRFCHGDRAPPSPFTGPGGAPRPGPPA